MFPAILKRWWTPLRVAEVRMNPILWILVGVELTGVAVGFLSRLGPKLHIPEGRAPFRKEGPLVVWNPLPPDTPSSPPLKKRPGIWWI